MEYIEFLKANWFTIICVLVGMCCISFVIVRWLQKPKAQQIADLKEWLKFAVTEAEKALGSGTGEIKLRFVYNKAVTLFPWVALFVSFEQFNEYVKEALEWMENELATNPSIAGYVGRE